MANYCVEQQAKRRRVLVYTSYTGKRDTTARLKALLSGRGLKVAVLRASVDTDKREDWVADQVDEGVDVLICNPELVKTGLDLLEFHPSCFADRLQRLHTDAGGKEVLADWDRSRLKWCLQAISTHHRANA